MLGSQGPYLHGLFRSFAVCMGLWGIFFVPEWECEGTIGLGGRGHFMPMFQLSPQGRVEKSCLLVLGKGRWGEGCSGRMYLAQSPTWRRLKGGETLQVWKKSKAFSSPVDLGPRYSK